MFTTTGSGGGGVVIWDNDEDQHIVVPTLIMFWFGDKNCTTYGLRNRKDIHLKVFKVSLVNKAKCDQTIIFVWINEDSRKLVFVVKFKKL